MSLSKKDFEEIADHLGMALWTLDQTAPLTDVQVSVLTQHVIGALASTNNNFRGDLFVAWVDEVRSTGQYKKKSHQPWSNAFDQSAALLDGADLSDV